MEYQHYAIFASELQRLGIPRNCAGPVLYSYWVKGNFCGYIDADRLMFDLDSGAIKNKRGFGVKTINALKAWANKDIEPACYVA
jgi:hypothetical protein